MNQDRRNFLKIILIGSGAFLVQGIVGPLYSRLFGDSSEKTDSSNEIGNSFENFRIVRNNDGLSIFDKAGQEIFQIDNKV